MRLGRFVQHGYGLLCILRGATTHKDVVKEAEYEATPMPELLNFLKKIDSTLAAKAKFGNAPL